MSSCLLWWLSGLSVCGGFIVVFFVLFWVGGGVCSYRWDSTRIFGFVVDSFCRSDILVRWGQRLLFAFLLFIVVFFLVSSIVTYGVLLFHSGSRFLSCCLLFLCVWVVLGCCLQMVFRRLFRVRWVPVFFLGDWRFAHKFRFQGMLGWYFSWGWAAFLRRWIDLVFLGLPFQKRLLRFVAYRPGTRVFLFCWSNIIVCYLFLEDAIDLFLLNIRRYNVRTSLMVFLWEWYIAENL